ncbi:poly [ADP-ribose] polymerase 1-like isoform X2 [Papaver somniferum]|uniref:poly [ADP-ribose] polymerase 1-like isoform X2 n=1 Tax=Papaver somniferum TaxID=3469 RepID=UPI000E703E98|nr:poly [ADP-ribose] polymerase 1-like isoform X2 [Papaver somniferum]
MSTPPQKPWKAEYAKSGRSSCKTCKSPIAKEILRLGKMVQATQFDGFMPMWNHASCILKKANQIKSPDDVEGLDSLRWEDQQKIRKYVEGVGSSSSAPTATTSECGVEVSPSGRAACRHCSEKIPKGEVRLSTKAEGPGARGVQWHHATCFLKSSPSTQVDKLTGWDKLSVSEQQNLRALNQKGASTVKQERQKNEEHAEQSAKVGTKRKMVAAGDQVLKIPKPEEGVSSSRGASEKHGSKAVQPASDLETTLEAQSKEIWAIKDDLKKHVATSELREMLEANEQDSAGSEFDLRDRCADGMLFGALTKCPICSGPLHYSGGNYRCHGYVSAWSKCSYSTTSPERVKEKWRIPEETSNEYLCQWFKSQKARKPIRVLPPPSSNKALGNQAVNVLSQTSKVETLEGLKVSFAGFPKKSMKTVQEEWKRKIEGGGVLIHPKVKRDTDCLVVSGEADGEDPEIKKARRMKVSVVRASYIEECMKRQKRLPFDQYKVEAVGKASKSIVTVKVKGRSAVHEASGLQDTGHILEDGRSIYNTTLNMSDLSTGVNSYYILQVIQDDKGSDCHVFRKWGRVGNDKIGGTKLEEMSKSDAIIEFKRLFLEKTGNTWESWEQKDNFQKQPGRFFPLDIDYGVNKQLKEKKSFNEIKSHLAPPLVELMKMLFNVETYRNAMMEFEINMSEMPLGKLSKSNIQKGFEALTEIQNLLSGNSDSSMKESLLVDASNRFFTVIPSIHPHVIRGEDDFKLKVKMLEALQDIEIASKLVGFNGDDDDETLDDKYKKLHCNIKPLPHDSDDYKLVEKYLHTTHAPTHMDWGLELEDVFTLERAGEVDKFAPYRQKLKNRMLLWHGSRLTNFVGILSQGLRIAPPEAPATGYMFGKGVYFADLVSKSAQYCFTDKKNPVGLMLLSEVALGEVHELKKASYMDKPPGGKHSTKGLGKMVPKESEHVKWRDDVVVPCGKPVASNVRASELMYNEYIVYNTAQVKMQFLLKVRFKHKR